MYIFFVGADSLPLIGLVGGVFLKTVTAQQDMDFAVLPVTGTVHSGAAAININVRRHPVCSTSNYHD